MEIFKDLLIATFETLKEKLTFIPAMLLMLILWPFCAIIAIVIYLLSGMKH